VLSKLLRLGLLGLLVPLFAHAQDTYPFKAVTVVVPYPPGGQADLAARPLAHALQQVLKQPFVVMNRPGAAGAVGNRAVASAAPDGYTVLVTLVSITTIPEVESMFGRPLSYTMDQFAPLALLAADPPVLVVGAQHPWKSLKELIDAAKAKPDDLVYSHSGLYGPSHLPMEMLLHAAGIKMRGLPAVGGGPTMQLVLGGSSAMWASPPAMAAPQVSAGKMRALASFGAKRHPAFPDIPTLKEQGYDVEFSVWAGAFAPAGTPAPVLATLRDAIRKAVASPDFSGAMEKMKTPVSYMDAPEFQKFLERDAEALRKAVRAIGKVE
jgi:tripartite-type tricarboxylate transporter receptor subunit TctC